MKRSAPAISVLVATTGCLQAFGLGAPWPAPDFALMDIDGVALNLTGYRGRVLVVDLMATWCIPCIAQMEHLQTVRDGYAESDVEILSIGTDGREPDAMLRAFRERYDGDWPFARDTDAVSQKLRLRILPKLVVIDPEGNVVFENQGETYPAAMARAINPHVGEAP